MNELHAPVLLREVLEALEPTPGKRIVDGTFGAGGYSRAFLERGAKVTAFARDRLGPDNRASLLYVPRGSDERSAAGAQREPEGAGVEV